MCGGCSHTLLEMLSFLPFFIQNVKQIGHKHYYKDVLDFLNDEKKKIPDRLESLQCSGHACPSI